MCQKHKNVLVIIGKNCNEPFFGKIWFLPVMTKKKGQIKTT